MHDTKERLSLLWIFALLNYLYADVFALFEPAGEYHRGWHYDPCKRFPDLRCASARVGPATCFCRVPVLRNHRNCMHRGHRLAGVEMVRV